MNQVQDTSEKVFHSQDLVVWHSHSGKRYLPIPSVVVRQEEHNVIIRTRVEGKVQELKVSPNELFER